MEVRVMGQMDNTIDHTFESVNRVYDKNGLCPTILCWGGLQPKVIEETKCVGGYVPMIFEDFYANRKPRVYEEIAPALRSERNGLKTIGVWQISSEGSQCGTVVSDEGLSPTLSAGTHGYANPHVLTQFRIRKLMPRECWRLMGFSDEDFDKAQAVNSDTQLYKEAGNSICKPVLMAIFRQLNIKGVERWNKE